MTIRTTRTWLATVVALVLLAAACGDDDGGEAVSSADQSSETVEVDEAALQGILDQWRTDGDAYGATLSIRVPGQEDIHLASGVDDRDPETAMPIDGTYLVASITKTFVAATALQLVDEGRLSLDEPVRPWLPELPNADEITLEMLLGHTAGLGTWTAPNSPATSDEPETILADLTRSFTPEEVLAKHLEQPPLGQPGEGFAYTNAAYDAVGLLIERELGQDLAAVVEERFAEPLQLEDTWLSDGSTKPTRHGWFSLDDDPARPLDNLDFPHQAAITSLYASASMVSSSADMLDWGEALFSGDLLGEQTTATMLEMRSSAASSELGVSDHYGLGVAGYCLDQPGCAPDEVELVGHPGYLANGSIALLAYHRDSGATVIVHANVGDVDAIRLLAAVSQELGQADPS